MTEARPSRISHLLRASRPALAGLAFLLLISIACIVTLPWTTGRAATASGEPGLPRYNQGRPDAGRLPPSWWPATDSQQARANSLVPTEALADIARASGRTRQQVLEAPTAAEQRQLRQHWPAYWLGSDNLGRSLFLRCLTGGGISLGVGFSAALLSVIIGTLYGAIAGYAGGRIDAILMRIVDVLYALPYVLLVVLIAVAADAVADRIVMARAARREAFVQQQVQSWPEPERADPARIEEARRAATERFGSGEIPQSTRTTINITALLIAIGGVSWLTLARVIRGQVLSLKNQPFIEAARAIGATRGRIFLRHLLPNLIGPIVVYTTLTVPQAILQESFLSFLGIGIKPPLPSWGNLAAEGLGELNPYQSNWWLLLFPCLLLGLTLLALNFVGEALREGLDPKRAQG
ncbi:MAG: ABC transporter permease [Phycisphaerales bacterium]|nr:ABC transporter permease [Phycisphaerales bacterium]